jgi:putative phage-type endonuclease
MQPIILRNESREAWLKARNKGLGGTDIASILGVNKYKSPYQVWEDKTGRGQKFEGNKMTRRGQYMEDAVANYFEDATGMKIIKASESAEICIHPTYSYLIGSTDRRYFNPDGSKGVLECKTTMSSFEADISSLPQSWFVQLQWYLGLTGYKRGAIAWGELGYSSDFKHVIVDFNPDFFNYIVGEGVRFWNEYVTTDTPPPATTSADVERIYSIHAPNKFITASDEFFQTYSELKELKGKAKDLEADICAREEALKLVLGDAEGARYGDDILVTWKAAKGSIKFDDKALKAADPETWARYIKETSGSRRFLLK